VVWWKDTRLVMVILAKEERLLILATSQLHMICACILVLVVYLHDDAQYLCCYGTLCSAAVEVVTDVSHHSVGPIFEGQIA